MSAFGEKRTRSAAYLAGPPSFLCKYTAPLLPPRRRSNRLRGVFEPLARLRVDQRTDDPAHALVIAVEPAALLVRQHARLDEPPVDRRERQCLEGIERLFGAHWLGRGNHQHQVFDPDAIGGGFAMAGAVRQDQAATG